MSDLLNKASLVMVPSGYKEDTVYSVVPSDGSGDLSFTRASNGTRVNSAGLVEVCPWNLADNSEDMNNQPFNVDITVNLTATTSPIGTNNGNKVSETATTNLHAVRTNKATPNGYDIVSIYAKAAERTFIQIQSWADPTNYVNFNLSTGVVSAYSVATIYGIESVGNGWYRCYANVQASGGGIVGVGIITSGTAGWAQSYLGDTSKGVYMWGLQINIGSTAKPYFPTTDRLNVPRLTYQNGGGGCPSLLLEKQSTNLVTYSEQFDNADWTKLQTSITANSLTSPDGTTNADTLTADGSLNEHQLRSTGIFTITSGQAYTTTIFAKVGTNNFVQLIGSGAIFSATTYANFNIATGVIGDVGSGTTATIQNFGNGWYRCSMTATAVSTSSTNTFLFNIITSNTAIRGESNTLSTSVYIWGAQVEASSYPTSYIPTTSSSATRVADFASSPLQTTNANWTIYVDTYFVQYEEILNLLVNTTTSRFVGFYQSFNYFRLVGNAGAGIFAGRVMSDTDGRKKVVLQNDGTDCIVFVNGVKLGGVDTSGASPLTGRASFQFQFYGGGTGVANKGRVNEIVQFDSKLSDAECITLSTL